MAKSRRRSIYPILLILLANGAVLAGALAPILTYGWEPGPPVDIAAAGWPGPAALVLSLVGLAIAVVVGVLLRAIPKIPALVLAIFPVFVAGVGLFGTYAQATLTLDATSGASVDASQKLRIVGEGLYGALNGSVIAGYVAAALMLGASLTIALRHWPSRGTLSSGAKVGLWGGAFLLLGMIIGSFFWKPLGGLGPLPWLASLGGIVSIAISAHAIRNDPKDEANVQAAGELWVTLLLAIGALVLVSSAGHTAALMEGAAIFQNGAKAAAPNLEVLTSSWTNAELAFYASGLFAIPLLLAAFTSMMSRASLGTWGLRHAGSSLFIVPILVAIPAAMQYVETVWVANELATVVRCDSPLLKNADATPPTVSLSPDQLTCEERGLVIGRTNVTLNGAEIAKSAELDMPGGCAKVVAKIDQTPDFNAVVLVDESVPYARAACLGKALEAGYIVKAKTELWRGLHPDKAVSRQGVLLTWVLMGDKPLAEGARKPFGSMSKPMAVAGTFGPHAMLGDANLTSVRLFEGGWEVGARDDKPAQRFDGAPDKGVPALLKLLGPKAQIVLLPADSVQMRAVLAYANAFSIPQLAAKPDPVKEPAADADAGVADGEAGVDPDAADGDASESAAPPGSATPPASASAAPAVTR